MKIREYEKYWVIEGKRYREEKPERINVVSFGASHLMRIRLHLSTSLCLLYPFFSTKLMSRDMVRSVT